MPATKQVTKQTATKQAAATTPSKERKSKKVEEVVEEVEAEEQVVEEHAEDVESEAEDNAEAESDAESEAEADAEAEDSSKKSRKSKKVEFTCETVDEALAELLRIDGEIEQAIKLRKVVFKVYQKLSAKLLKQSKRRRNQTSETPKEATGFIKAKPVPEKFQTFYQAHSEFFNTLSDFKNFKADQPQPRTEITKMIYAYIRDKNLYEKKDGTINKRVIIPDRDLQTLLDVSKDETIGFSNFQTFVSRLYADKETEAESSAEEAEAEEAEEVEQVQPAAKAKGGKAQAASKSAKH